MADFGVSTRDSGPSSNNASSIRGPPTLNAGGGPEKASVVSGLWHSGSFIAGQRERRGLAEIRDSPCPVLLSTKAVSRSAAANAASVSASVLGICSVPFRRGRDHLAHGLCDDESSAVLGHL